MRAMILGISFMVWGTVYAQSSDWPTQASGQLQIVRRGQSIGACQVTLVLRVVPRESLEGADLKFSQCRTIDRQSFEFDDRDQKTNWVWKNGKGWFDGKLAGQVTEREIRFETWTGHRLRIQKMMDPKKLRIYDAFYFDGRYIEFKGVLRVKETLK